MANVAVSEKSLVVLNYLKSINGANVTAADIAEALGMEKKSVDGIVTSGLQRKGLTERVPAQVEVTDEDGNTKYVDVKFIKLTDKGVAYDHEAAQAEDAAAKAE
jgi:Mn-dependent DtxR family transcriptional regulator